MIAQVITLCFISIFIGLSQVLPSLFNRQQGLEVAQLSMYVSCLAITSANLGLQVHFLQRIAYPSLICLLLVGQLLRYGKIHKKITQKQKNHMQTPI